MQWLSDLGMSRCKMQCSSVENQAVGSEEGAKLQNYQRKYKNVMWFIFILIETSEVRFQLWL